MVPRSRKRITETEYPWPGVTQNRLLAVRWQWVDVVGNRGNGSEGGPSRYMITMYFISAPPRARRLTGGAVRKAEVAYGGTSVMKRRYKPGFELGWTRPTMKSYRGGSRAKAPTVPRNHSVTQRPRLRRSEEMTVRAV